MNLTYLEKNKVVRDLVNSIISDKTFMEKCEMNFKQIFEDGKVDKDDIPLIINLFLTVYNNHNKIRVSKANLKPVFMLLITRLLTEFKGDTGLDEQMILLLLEPQIDILLMSVKAINCKFPCCGSKPQEAEEKEVQVYHKMKLNKIEKKRVEASKSVTGPASVEVSVSETSPSPEILPKDPDKKISE